MKRKDTSNLITSDMVGKYTPQCLISKGPTKFAGKFGRNLQCNTLKACDPRNLVLIGIGIACYFTFINRSCIWNFDISGVLYLVKRSAFFSFANRQ